MKTKQARSLFTMCMAVIFMHVTFSMLLFLFLSKTRYTFFWDGLESTVECERPQAHHRNLPRLLQTEIQCHASAHHFLHRLLHPVKHRKTIDVDRFNDNLCIIITTTHPSDQSDARNKLDFFNVTLSSLLYAYNVYQGGGNYNSAMVNDHIVIFEYATNPNGMTKDSYKRDIVEQLWNLNPGTKLQYKQNVFDPHHLSWHQRVVKHGLDALSYCKAIDDRIEYALVLQDDIVVGDDLFNHLEDILNSLIADKSMEKWFYIKLFHTDHWSGWSSEKWTHLAYLMVIFVVSVLIFHWIFNGQFESCGSRWRLKSWNRKLIDWNLWITILVYSLCGSSCVWFVIGIGKQNVDFYAERYLLQYDRVLLPMDSGGQRAMAQASLYDLQHVDRIKEYYQRQLIALKKEYKSIGFDVVISGYSQENNLSEFEYFPSLVQHIGRASSSSKKNKRRKCHIQYLKQAMTFIGSALCDTK